MSTLEKQMLLMDESKHSHLQKHFHANIIIKGASGVNQNCMLLFFGCEFENINCYQVHLLKVLIGTACIHSNIKFMKLRYITAVHSICSTSPFSQKYPHRTSSSAEIPLVSTAWNSSSIREEPVS